MLKLDFHPTGKHFLQIPGPSPVPDRILRAMSLPTIDHRGPEFGVLGARVLTGMQAIFKTRHPVIIYPASGTGAWEAGTSTGWFPRSCPWTKPSSLASPRTNTSTVFPTHSRFLR